MSTINSVGTGLSGSTGTGEFVGSASPTISGTLTLSGSSGLVLPSGNTAARGSTAGMIRLNTQTGLFESTVDGSAWATIETSAVGVTSAAGTANQVLVNGTSGSGQTGALTFTLPQSIGTSSAVEFASVKFSTNNGLIDSNGNEIFNFSPELSAVNNVNIFNADTGFNPGFEPVGSDTNIGLTLSAKGTGGVYIQGVSDGSSAPSGYVGQLVTNSYTTVTLTTTATSYNVCSLSLTAGDWDVYGMYELGPAAYNVTNTTCGLSSTSATLPSAGFGYWMLANEANTGIGAMYLGEAATQISAPFNLSSTTTIYLVAQATFATGSSPSGSGQMYARRVR